MSSMNKYNSMSVQAKAAVWFTMCSFMQKGISFITVPIFTRLMSTDQYGIYTVYLSWLQILTIITSLYLFNGVYDNAMVKFESYRDQYTSSMQGLTFTITLFVYGLYLVFEDICISLVNLPAPLINYMFLEALITPALSYWSGRQRFEYRYKLLVTITLLQSLLNPIIGLTLISFWGGTAKARITGIVIVQMVICVPIIVYQFVKGKVFYNKKYWGYALKIGVPILPHYLSGMVLNQGDRIMIDKMVGKTEVALYGLAYSIGMIAQLFVTAINSAITPWMYKKIRNHENVSMRKTLNILIVIVACIDMALMFISPELVLIFGSDKYQSAVWVIPPVAASVFFIFLYGILSLPQFYYEKTKFLMNASIIAAGANIVLNFIFIRIFGFVAAGYTTLICYILYAIGHYYMSKKVLIQNGEAEHLLDGKFVFIVGSILVFVSILSSFLFRYTFVRYFILALGIGILIMKKKTIIDFLFDLRKKG